MNQKSEKDIKKSCILRLNTLIHGDRVSIANWGEGRPNNDATPFFKQWKIDKHVNHIDIVVPPETYNVYITHDAFPDEDMKIQNLEIKGDMELYLLRNTERSFLNP